MMPCSWADAAALRKNDESLNDDNGVAVGCCCRSNQTHIAWKIPAAESKGRTPNLLIRQQSRRQLLVKHCCHTSTDNDCHSCYSDDDDDDDDGCCLIQSYKDAQAAAQEYLVHHIMEFDLPFASTMGFPSSSDNNDDDDDNDDIDGLADGLIGPTIDLALQAKIEFEHTDSLPMSIWQEYVLNYANLNEARQNWRPLLWKRVVEPLLLLSSNSTSTEESTASPEQRPFNETVYLLNKHMWSMLAPKGSTNIVFVSSQSPAILDCMSVLAFGYASCTGLAILFVNALRTAGVPARVAGTGAWNQIRKHGNHNWVEVYWNHQWYFLEPTALAVEENNDPDTLERDPCKRWFCSKTRFNLSNTTTKVDAARLDSTTTYTFFRLAWDWQNQNVPADDQTEYYQKICSVCN